jgi:hypothetical protein
MAGRRRPARTAMIAITTSNSIKVKAPSRSREEFGSGLVITDVGYPYLLSIRG